MLNKTKGKRKVQGVPQSQTAALPRPQEEEETDKSEQAQTEQTNEKHQDQLSLPQARQYQKDRKTQEQNDTRKDTQQIAPQNKPQSNKEQDQHRDHRPRKAGSANHRGAQSTFTASQLHPWSRYYS